MQLANKQIVVGVTGGIAAYKSAELVRRLRDSGAIVRVVMTAAAKEFITPLTMQAVSNHVVHDDLFNRELESAMSHIELARWADLIIVAPASANVIAKLANGQANDLLTTLCLATTAPIAIVPAMNQQMWKNTLTQHNLQLLKKHEFHIWGPASGEQACGENGYGRMLEPLDIIAYVKTLFQNPLLANLNVIVTAGPTQEAIDPVRFITNTSSGKMGYAIANAAVVAGARVTLISGPVALKPLLHCKNISVVSAEDMYKAVMEHVAECDIFISVAAVADYRCEQVSQEKIAKQQDRLQLSLIKNPDILTAVANLKSRPFVVGFAAETDHVLQKAYEKLNRKNIDMIIANQVGENLGFNNDDNEVTALWGQQQQAFPKMPKHKLAHEIIKLIATIKTKQQEKITVV